MSKTSDDMIARRGPLTRDDLGDIKHELVNAANACFAAAQLLADGVTPERVERAERAEARMREVFEMVDAAYWRQRSAEHLPEWQTYARAHLERQAAADARKVKIQAGIVARRQRGGKCTDTE